MKNEELEIYFTNEKFKWEFNKEKNHYELKELFLTNMDLNNLITTINFFDWSVCFCLNKFIIHDYKNQINQ